MATNDVPGHNPANNDELHVGCWAEHDDGSLLLVEGIDDNAARVIYVVFDLSKPPVTEYRDAMPIAGFKPHFSWKPADGGNKPKWLWHDKTPFPWNRVIKAGAKDGPRLSALEDIVTAAARAVQTKNRILGKPQPVTQAEIDDIIARIQASKAPKGAAKKMIDRIQAAIKGMKA